MSLVRRRQFLVAMLGLLAAPPARAQQRAKPVRIGVLGVNKLNLRTAFWKPLFTELTSANTDQEVVRVKDGTLLAFPSYLHHSVDTNVSGKSRASVSFD